MSAPPPKPARTTRPGWSDGSARAPPIIDALAKWMADTYNKEPPESPLAKACYYAIARRRAGRA